MPDFRLHVRFGQERTQSFNACTLYELPSPGREKTRKAELLLKKGTCTFSEDALPRFMIPKIQVTSTLAYRLVPHKRPEPLGALSNG